MPMKRRRAPNSKLPKVNSKEKLTTAELKLRLQSLKKRSAALDKEIEELRAKGVTEDLQPEMKALHDYNDIKDVTQMVLGVLADEEQCTVGSLHKKYNLPLE
ncbi:unnamed protein product [Ceutorhynchus assimilis]|uniref:DNA repair protein SWI5 homolog n=1 Tax=Ceutorhynchus assimilis TaxID=467358 RepID=A0A9N9QFU0_9CUCU|nr:unnamed protein product [Ceutorhynchus assimilis]